MNTNKEVTAAQKVAAWIVAIIFSAIGVVLFMHGVDQMKTAALALMIRFPLVPHDFPTRLALDLAPEPKL